MLLGSRANAFTKSDSASARSPSSLSWMRITRCTSEKASVRLVGSVTWPPSETFSHDGHPAPAVASPSQRGWRTFATILATPITATQATTPTTTLSPPISRLAVIDPEDRVQVDDWQRDLSGERVSEE